MPCDICGAGSQYCDYSCVKICPEGATFVRGYDDFATKKTKCKCGFDGEFVLRMFGRQEYLECPKCGKEF